MVKHRKIIASLVYAHLVSELESPNIEFETFKTLLGSKLAFGAVWSKKPSFNLYKGVLYIPSLSQSVRLFRQID